MATSCSHDGEDSVSAVLAAGDHFTVLGLPVQAVTADVVKKKYYRLALLVHPDKNRNPKVLQHVSDFGLNLCYFVFP